MILTVSSFYYKCMVSYYLLANKPKGRDWSKVGSVPWLLVGGKWMVRKERTNLSHGSPSHGIISLSVGGWSGAES